MYIFWPLFLSSNSFGSNVTHSPYGTIFGPKSSAETKQGILSYLSIFEVNLYTCQEHNCFAKNYTPYPPMANYG